MPTILLVEDNEANRVMLDRRLRRLGYSVVMAIDGEQGYALAYSVRPDLVLMDVTLPGMNGLRATRLLKASQRTRHIPIIVLTADPANREDALAAGCDAYATKPIAFAKLQEIIEGLLARTKVSAS